MVQQPWVCWWLFQEMVTSQSVSQTGGSPAPTAHHRQVPGSSCQAFATSKKLCLIQSIKSSSVYLILKSVCDFNFLTNYKLFDFLFTKAACRKVCTNYSNYPNRCFSQKRSKPYRTGWFPVMKLRFLGTKNNVEPNFTSSKRFWTPFFLEKRLRQGIVNDLPQLGRQLILGTYGGWEFQRSYWNLGVCLWVCCEFWGGCSVKNSKIIKFVCDKSLPIVAFKSRISFISVQFLFSPKRSASESFIS